MGSRLSFENMDMQMGCKHGGDDQADEGGHRIDAKMTSTPTAIPIMANPLNSPMRLITCWMVSAIAAIFP
jgi:hypothetical protein